METVKIVIELSEEDYKLALSRAALLGGMLDKRLVDAVRSGRRIEENAIGDDGTLTSVNPQESKTGYCKDCKWWKDSNGAFRRGIGAESICRINTDIVYQGEGYCYLFEPKESEEE